MRTMMIMAAAAIAFGAPKAAHAVVFEYEANLVELNSSGVTGSARLMFDDAAMTLGVLVQAQGLEPNQIHPQHIHGPVDPVTGAPVAAQSPTIADDEDGDGFVELLEGAPRYGPVILDLRDDTLPGVEGFPTAPDGTINFSFTYDLNSTSAFAAGFGPAELGDLSLREIVIHGLTLGAGQGAGPGEADGTAGYKLVLPLATGQFSQVAAVPVPAAGLLLLSGLGALFVTRGKKRRAA